MHRRFLVVLPLVAVLFVFAGCGDREEEASGGAPEKTTRPEIEVKPDSDRYRRASTAFHVGVAAVRVNRLQQGVRKLKKVTELVPAEPAPYANLAVVSMRKRDFDRAEQLLKKARARAPDHPDLLYLTGFLARRRGRIDRAVNWFRRAADRASGNPRIQYALVRELKRQGLKGNRAEIRDRLERLLTADPDNLVLQLEMIRVVAFEDRTEALDDLLTKLERRISGGPEDVRDAFQSFRTSIASDDPSSLAAEITFLENAFQDLPDYRRDRRALETGPSGNAALITSFLRLPNREAHPDSPDENLSFSTHTPETLDRDRVHWLRAPSLQGKLKTTLMGVSDGTLYLEGSNTSLSAPGDVSDSTGLAVFDGNYDFRRDLLLAGPDGLRLFRQNKNGTFKNMTPGIGLPDRIRTGTYTGAWPADLDMDGDLDVILGTPEDGPVLLRNNGDGTYAPMDGVGFEDVTGPRHAAHVDLDADGDGEVVFIDRSGSLHVYRNDRSAGFHRVRSLPDLPSLNDLATGDFDRDAHVELALLTGAGELRQLAYRHGDEGSWETEQWKAPAPLTSGGATSLDGRRLFSADVDNNGGLDLVVSGEKATRILLRTPDEKYVSGPRVPVVTRDVQDRTRDGRLDLIGTTPDGAPVVAENDGSKSYRGLILRPRANSERGERNINAFGIGGEIEMRSDLLYQKQPIRSPLVHFGLGGRETVHLVRFLWPDGTSRTTFSPPSRDEVERMPGLKGSCPWLFTYNGSEMTFVTDFIWRSPLGLRINAQDTAGVLSTEDRVKIEGRELAPRNGAYDVRITAELWETHYFDHVSLMTVDHPDDTEIFINERFTMPPPDLGVRVTGPSHPVAAARSVTGTNVTASIRARDNRYFHHFERTSYQGRAKEHYVEIDLGDDTPVQQPLWLIAGGWVRPTDSSINLALSQSELGAPRGVRIEVPDRDGNWVEVASNLGFPSGKNKTMLIDLEGLFKTPDDPRLRLYTTTETYWNMFRWARKRPDAPLRRRRLNPSTARLVYRGFTEITRSGPHAPERPANYDRISGTHQKWPDLTGFYTRFGPVRPLLMNVDDRYVIMNAGDELRMRFDAPGPPPDGWERDFVLIGDGWVKDGDDNTKYSQTVRPLPTHDKRSYDRFPPNLTDDPVYREHRSDWVNYHTRFVGPHRFRHALLPDK